MLAKKLQLLSDYSTYTSFTCWAKASHSAEGISAPGERRKGAEPKVAAMEVQLLLGSDQVDGLGDEVMTVHGRCCQGGETREWFWPEGCPGWKRQTGVLVEDLPVRSERRWRQAVWEQKMWAGGRWLAVVSPEGNTRRGEDRNDALMLVYLWAIRRILVVLLVSTFNKVAKLPVHNLGWLPFTVFSHNANPSVPVPEQNFWKQFAEQQQKHTGLPAPIKLVFCWWLKPGFPRDQFASFSFLAATIHWWNSALKEDSFLKSFEGIRVFQSVIQMYWSLVPSPTHKRFWSLTEWLAAS